MKIPEKILATIKKEKKMLIAAHINPDGDAIGSSVALSIALESVGKETFVYCRDPVPEFYRFLPKQNIFKTDFKNFLKSEPILILLDCNSPERAALDHYKFRISIVIDHHQSEKKFGDIRWIDRETAATGMMVFYLIKALGIKLTKEIATNLYTAISVDTGTFRYGSSAEVLKICAELVESGAEPNLIAYDLYDTWDRKRFNLLMKALSTLEIKKTVAMMHITKDMFKKTGASFEDTENFSNFPRMIDSVNISALFREVGRDMWKVSLRSKGVFNVAEIAEIYNGGGHKNAAGFRIKGNLKSAKKALLEASQKLKVQVRTKTLKVRSKE